MTPERWKQVESLYHAARNCDRNGLSQLLDEACGHDRELRREVESLLAARAGGSEFIERPAIDDVARDMAAERRRFRPGHRLGPYELVSLLGAGGMGEVWRATDLALRRDVAIKVLITGFSGDQEWLRRFEREARLAGMLNHPNLLTVYAVGTEKGLPYLVTELLEGESLRDRLSQGPFAPRKALDLAIQVAQGLSAAHDKGLVHRDLKPENIFITRDGRAKILDFGLAKMAQPAATLNPSLTQTGMVLGTPGYMSPEQVRGDAVDPRSDIFAFGTILLEMMTGRKVFPGNTPVDIMMAVVHSEPRDVDQCPAVLRKVVQRCLEKSAQDRFQSTRDLTFQLQLLTEASSAAARAEKLAPQAAQASPATHSVGPLKKRWTTAWGVIVGGLAGLLVLAIGYSLGRLVPDFDPPEVQNGTKSVVIPPKEIEPPPQPVPKADPAPPETTPEPAPSAPSLALVDFAVDSEPQGARVLLGEPRVGSCVTPCTLKAVPGSYALSIFRSGYREVRRQVTLAQGMRPLSKVLLFAAPAHLFLDSDPPGATIVVDGFTQSQVTPVRMELSPGPHKISLEKGELKGSLSLDLRADSITERSIALSAP